MQMVKEEAPQQQLKGGRWKFVIAFGCLEYMVDVPTTYVPCSIRDWNRRSVDHGLQNWKIDLLAYEEDVNGGEIELVVEWEGS